MAPSTRQARKRIVDSPSSDEEFSVSQVKTESTSTGEVTSDHEARSSSPASSTSTLSSPPASPTTPTKHITKDSGEIAMAALSSERERARYFRCHTPTPSQTKGNPRKLEQADGVRGAQDAAHPELSVLVAPPAQSTKDTTVEQGSPLTNSAKSIGITTVTSTAEVAPIANITQDERASEFEVEAAKRRSESRTCRESDGELTHGAATAVSDSDTNVTLDGNRPLGTHTNEADLSGINNLAKVNGDQSAESRMENQTNNEHQKEEEPALPSAKEAGEVVKAETTVPVLEAGQIEMPTSTTHAELVGPDRNAVAMPLQDAQHAKHREPSLAEQILKAVAKGERKSFNKGDMAVIVDTEDLSKTLLMCSDPVFRASKVLQEMSGRDDKSESIRHIFLLQAANGTADMPGLSSLSPTQTLEHFSESGVQCYSLVFKTAKKVKTESEDTDEDVNAPGPPSISWVKAFEAFFYVICGLPFRRIFSSKIFNSNATFARTQIEAVIAIGKQLDALPALASTFNELVLFYSGNRTLWPAIEKEAASWLLIGMIRESSLVYDEAFKHVAGRFPEWPWETPEVSVPKRVRDAVEAKSIWLHHKRDDIEKKLLTLSIPAPFKIKGRPGVEQMGYVSQLNNPIAYSTVNLWSDWFREHLGYLLYKDDPDGDDSPPVSALCDHKEGECLTDAGLFRMISKGGDSYLPAEAVLENWNRAYFKPDDATIRATLQKMKSKATVIVKDLVQSTLNGSNDKLDYLTCIDIEDEDVPWETSMDEDVLSDCSAE